MPPPPRNFLIFSKFRASCLLQLILISCTCFSIFILQEFYFLNTSISSISCSIWRSRSHLVLRGYFQCYSEDHMGLGMLIMLFLFVISVALRLFLEHRNCISFFPIFLKIYLKKLHYIGNIVNHKTFVSRYIKAKV